MDGQRDPARIAEVIARCQPDIAALQEVDVGRARSGGIDQAQLIAAHLQMNAHFHPAIHLAEEKYGDAILTALPARLVRAGPLPSIGEPRGAIWMAIDIGGVELHVINTHLGLRRRERQAQIAALHGPDWLGSAEVHGAPTAFLGDFNATGSSALYRGIIRDWHDVQRRDGAKPRATFPSRFPVLRLDYIFVSKGICVLESSVHSDMLARMASDHLPLLATLTVPALASSSLPMSVSPPAR